MFIKYDKWECYQNKMWSKVDKKVELEMLNKATIFTSDHILYGQAMNEVMYLWKYSMLNFLTNYSINRKAYLGHCAVCYKLGIPEYIVRMAWNKLTNEQRYLANKEAENNIKKWEIWYMQKLENMLKNGKKNATQMGYQMKLQLK